MTASKRVEHLPGLSKVSSGEAFGEPAVDLGQLATRVVTSLVLAARIDRLRPELKRLLQAAAVVGTDVSVPLLEAIADIGGDELQRALAELQTAEFLYEARLFPDLEYTFKHALTPP